MQYQSLPVVRVPRRSWWNLINRHRVYLELQISVGSNQDWKNISKLAIIVIIIQKRFVNAGRILSQISDVILNQGIPNNDIRGAPVAGVLTKKVKICMCPSIISIQTVIPFFFDL